MKGLLQKDFYLMRTLARSYAFILGVFFLISLTGVYDGTFLCTFLVLMCVMIPANTFSYDEQAKWDKYAVSLPAGRPGVVRAKYLFTLLVSLAALALAALLQALLFFLGRAGDGLHRADVLEGEQHEQGAAQHAPLVHHAELRAAAVGGIVAVVAHNENRALRHHHMGGEIGGELPHGLQNIRLIQDHPVHIDGVALVVDVHGLPPHGDDPLDDGLALPEGLLAQHHHVARLRRIADGLQEQHIVVVQGGHHGRAVHADDAPDEGKDENEAHQGHHQRLEPEVEIHLQRVPVGEPALLFAALLGLEMFFFKHGVSLPIENR